MDTAYTFRLNPVFWLVMACAALAVDRDAYALTFLVGSDGACDYNSIQAAINGAASRI